MKSARPPRCRKTSARTEEPRLQSPPRRTPAPLPRTCSPTRRPRGGRARAERSGCLRPRKRDRGAPGRHGEGGDPPRIRGQTQGRQQETSEAGARDGAGPAGKPRPRGRPAAAEGARFRKSPRVVAGLGRESGKRVRGCIWNRPGGERSAVSAPLLQRPRPLGGLRLLLGALPCCEQGMLAKEAEDVKDRSRLLGPLSSPESSRS
ncbi:translation initiation factor IF-2-like isoform X1 [Camelus ferus]|uniref:Translation initiation factor IF-2-like isoform X1 n=1 Tax=Camelus ferus TaxID=419612 RepID=A0A8B8UCV9_CAMFR|nr:translation initiation factor IF-2-like isoform X1 [Camelus ferus]